MMMLAFALAAVAADAITGKWVYEQEGRQGGPPRQVTLNLKAEGATLTGTVAQPMGGRGGGAGGAQVPAPVEIRNGKVDGSNISFEVVREMGGQPMTTKYEGAVSGSEMKLKVTRETPGGPRTDDVVAKKSAT
jgi:hypothetical protein